MIKYKENFSDETNTKLEWNIFVFDFTLTPVKPLLIRLTSSTIMTQDKCARIASLITRKGYKSFNVPFLKYFLFQLHPHTSWRKSYFHHFYTYNKERNGHQSPLLPVTCHVNMCLTICQESVPLWFDDWWLYVIYLLSWICFRKVFVRTLCIGKTLTFFKANYGFLGNLNPISKKFNIFNCLVVLCRQKNEKLPSAPLISFSLSLIWVKLLDN